MKRSYYTGPRKLSRLQESHLEQQATHFYGWWKRERFHASVLVLLLIPLELNNPLIFQGRSGTFVVFLGQSFKHAMSICVSNVCGGGVFSTIDCFWKTQELHEQNPVSIQESAV